MRVIPVEIMTYDAGPVTVAGRVFQGCSGLAITPTPIDVRDWRTMSLVGRHYGGYSITHIPSGRAVVAHIPAPVEAYRLLRDIAAIGVDWTQEYDRVRRLVPQRQRQRLQRLRRWYVMAGGYVERAAGGGGRETTPASG